MRQACLSDAAEKTCDIHWKLKMGRIFYFPKISFEVYGRAKGAQTKKIA
jgi:hypothetical protein